MDDLGMMNRATALPADLKAKPRKIREYQQGIRYCRRIGAAWAAKLGAEHWHAVYQFRKADGLL